MGNFLHPEKDIALNYAAGEVRDATASMEGRPGDLSSAGSTTPPVIQARNVEYVSLQNHSYMRC
jgi:hypothetical protein